MDTLLDFVPEDTAITWGGINFTGFAPDTYITISRNSPNTATSVGADGSVGITKVADKTGTIEITLMQTSDTHRFLSAVQNAQDFSSLVRSNMTVSDPSGGYLCRAYNVHIMEAPEVSLGSDQNPKAWTFFAERVVFTELPAGFTQKAGEASRIDDALDGILRVSGKLTEQIGG